MATTIANRLDGPLGEAPDEATLERSAIVGALDAVDTTGPLDVGRARYSAEHTVHGLATTRVDPGYSFAQQPRYVLDLPEPAEEPPEDDDEDDEEPAAEWWVRFYAWVPPMQAAGHGINEVRWLVGWPDVGLGLVVHETAAGNIGTRLQPSGLASPSIGWSSESGSAVAIGQWWRVELHYDGQALTSSVFPGHATSGARVHRWDDVELGGTLELTGYRYRRGVLLAPGDNDDSTDGAVGDLQRDLLALGYELPQFGDDGDYGGETIDAVTAFQEEHALLADGYAGPETLAAVDLALRVESDPDDYPPQVFLSHVAVSDSAPLGPAPGPVRSAHAWLRVSAVVEGEADEGAVSARARLAARAELGVTRSTTAPLTAPVRLVATAPATRHVTIGVHARVQVRARLVVRADEVLALDYAAAHLAPPFEPTDDDDGLVNTVQATRRDGGEETYQLLDGPLGAAHPPEGVGPYEESVTLDVARDEQLGEQASWRVHLGTTEGYRYPHVRVNLVGNPHLIDLVAERDTGDGLTVLNPPPWLPPEPVELMIEGYTETLNAYRWDVEFNASPGAPWIIGQALAEEDGEPAEPGENQPNRTDTADTRLAVAVDENTTLFEVSTHQGPRWITSAEFPDELPFDIRCGGEVMRVQSITGTGRTQTFTVIRAMNTIRQPHPAGEQVALAQPAVVGL